MGTLDGKVAVVTGASSGLGRAAALRLAREGAKLVLGARRVEQSEAVVQEIQALGTDAIFVRTDVSKPGDLAALVARAVDRFGRLDCAVNNAGITGPVLVPLAEVEETAWDELIAVNLTAVFVGMKYQIPAMLASGGGAIVNIASIYGLRPADLGNTPYIVSKHGVIALTKSAAVDYAQAGIRINAVCPGFTHSEMVDPYVEAAPDLMKATIARHSASNRLGEAAEIAEAVTWLCSPAASFVNGASLVVDGGPTTRLY
jgi:NAD(P)-dependent dehydrogenase (short-subunit alcohol dehydrogenase family)